MTNRDVDQIGMTTSGAARWLGVSPQTVAAWAQAGWLECHRTRHGRQWFTIAQLSELAASL